MNTLMDQPTKGDIKQALQHLAKGRDGLDKTYEQAMKRIEDQGSRIRELAKSILAWIIYAKRPLSTAELQHALGVRPLTKKLDEDYLPSTQVLRSVCAGLVTIDEPSGIVRLVHYTTQEYFERTWTNWFPHAQLDIANVCVTYLSFDVFETGFCQSDGEFEARLRTNVLYDYAARNWGYHAYAAVVEEGLVLNLLESRAKVSAAGQAMMAYQSYSGYSQRVPRQMTGVHVAAYFGLVETIIGLLKKGYNPGLQDSYGRTPLSWAAVRGHEAVVKLLLATEKVDLDSKDSYEQTPLSWAAMGGHEAVVKLLLATEKVDLDSRDFFSGQTPLSLAAERGHEAVVKLLLATEKADLDSKDSSGRTPLSWAAENGHQAVVKLLQSHCSTPPHPPPAEGSFFYTP
jgi:Ankyrin repeats (3 copies)/Ankyrin repeats (many copies)